ncbi:MULTISPECIES: GntR family transcriptional regulator [unclassified Rothia (in: high G+C Gram-positive bacteria)]|uniref:GntR family transcriptional regulator n=1 Tax=unclassified Rothia (in: high G+C Gram-positive bacteria) TaxID=2689056 RepID=UPI00195E1F0B|nr:MULTISPECIES: GntR family transcriptional regulator [unclassified Rothia (in: high G+C Gram-positive bacteria)]MBM7050818.1 GntR family transcriptional regulator [Rothia sp. ZJ1223]QRZ60993.1 GntR family transcriptional regulator [Rothia sp. ZJ932]
MNASEKAYTTLKEDILSTALEPGTVIGEVEQSERLGVSRTPLRAALERLKAEGLVVSGETRGNVVAPVSWEKVDQLYELRSALDPLAASLAALRGDSSHFMDLHERFLLAAQTVGSDSTDLTSYYTLVEELDRSIDEAANNDYLTQAQASLRVQLIRVRKLSKTNRERLEQAAHEHALIARSIAHKDSQLAQAITTVHLKNSLENIKQTIAPHR